MTEVRQLVEDWIRTHPNATIEDTFLAGYGAGVYEGYETGQNDLLKLIKINDILTIKTKRYGR